jgi:hypothetical protein
MFVSIIDLMFKEICGLTNDCHSDLPLAFGYWQLALTNYSGINVMCQL